jgi:uncharacterized membrane protein YdjX (TVP38/TMEM64 family)
MDYVHYLLSLQANLTGFGILLIALTVVCVAAIPSMIVISVTGAIFGFAGIPLILGSAVVVCSVQFLIARRLTGAAIGRLVNRRHKIRAIDQAFRYEGWRGVALLRLSPLPLGFQNYLLSATSVPFAAFLSGTTAGLIFPTVLWGSVGALGRAVLTDRSDPVYLLALSVGVLAIGTIIALVIHRAREIARYRAQPECVEFAVPQQLRIGRDRGPT